MMRLVERRSGSRFDVSLSGSAMTDSGYDCSIQIGNISASGLQFELSQEDAVKLIPQSISANILSPVSLLLSFDIDKGNSGDDMERLNSEKRIEMSGELQSSGKIMQVQCGIVYMKRKNLDVCFVGCRFENFLHNSAEMLTNYLEKIVD